MRVIPIAVYIILTVVATQTMTVYVLAKNGTLGKLVAGLITILACILMLVGQVIDFFAQQS
jgi:hypothetical protein